MSKDRKDGMTGTGKHFGAVWLAGALSCAGVGCAAAQGLPAHSVSFDPVTARCRIVLEPDGSTGAHPPRLFLSSDMLEPSLAFGLDGSGIVEAVVVRQGERQPFVGREGLTPEGLRADPVWSRFDSGPEGKDSVYVTVRDAEGDYSSARYDKLRQADILRLAVLACGIEGLDTEALTPVEHRAAEARLPLTDADRLHIRRLLAARYAEPGTDVGEGGRFTVTDRRFIARFNTDAGHPSGEYLWPAAVPALLAEAVKIAPPAAPAPAPAPGEAELSRHGDWVVLGDAAKGLCRVSTPATAVEGLEAGLRMEFAVDTAGRGGMMAIDLVKPNPFRADMPLAAVIDGQGFALQVEPGSGAVIPQPLPDGGMTNDLTRALRRGKTVTIEGVSAATGAPARLAFSAMGFGAAFKAMADACNRPGVMGWIE